MTSPYVSYTVFILICLLLLTLPFVPAFREWLRPTDLAALPVSANYTADIDHFARRLHADVAAKLGQGDATGYEDFDFVAEPLSGMDWAKARQRLISTHSIASADAIKSLQPLYVQGDLRAAGESAFSALYATGDIDLGPQTRVRDWAHADGVLRLGPKSVALRRVSAGVAIELGNEAWFERLNAPTLRFGTAPERAPLPAQVEQTPESYADLPGAVEQTLSLFLIRGDCALPPDRIYRGSLVVTGFLTVGAGTTVVGDIKARDGFSLGHRASIEGAITCEKRVYLFKDAQALGPVISESDILMGAGARVGRLDAPTTVSAVNVIVEDGAVVHGTLWAHEIGMVKAA